VLGYIVGVGFLSAYHGFTAVLALALIAFGATGESRDLVFLVALFVISTSTFFLGYGIGDGFLSFFDLVSSTAITVTASLCGFFFALQKRPSASTGSVATGSDMTSRGLSPLPSSSTQAPAEQASMDSRIKELTTQIQVIESQWRAQVEKQLQHLQQQQQQQQQHPPQ